MSQTVEDRYPGHKLLDRDDWVTSYKVEIDTSESPDERMPKDIGYKDPRLKTHPNHIWTFLDIDCDCTGPDVDADPEGHEEFWDGHIETCPEQEDPEIFNGFHFVNRMAHYFSEVPWKDGEDIGVR